VAQAWRPVPLQLAVQLQILLARNA
jgi:hypothetical protein